MRYLALALLLTGCFPVRPDTAEARACTAAAALVADSKFRAEDSMLTQARWVQDEGRAYDECMTKTRG